MLQVAEIVKRMYHVRSKCVLLREEETETIYLVLDKVSNLCDCVDNLTDEEFICEFRKLFKNENNTLVI